jgi:hypothetical protein
VTAEGGAAAAVARWGAVAATVVVCVAAAGVHAVAAPTSEPEAAYWWAPEPVSGLIPVPGVPSNGLYVASSPTGPQAESAVRIRVPQSTGFVRLRLHVSLQERVGRPALVAYPATSHWQTGGPQPWSARPSYRASAKPTKGVFSDHGEIMTLTIPAHYAATGVVLLPDPSVSGTFTIAFTPPHAADVHAAATRTPTPSSSASATHRPTPTKSHHSATPSSSPSHPRKTHKPSKSPKPTPKPTTKANPSASASASPVAPSTSSDSGHGGLIAALVAAGALAATGAGVGVFARRRHD